MMNKVQNRIHVLLQQIKPITNRLTQPIPPKYLYSALLVASPIIMKKYKKIGVTFALANYFIQKYLDKQQFIFIRDGFIILNILLQYYDKTKVLMLIETITQIIPEFYTLYELLLSLRNTLSLFSRKRHFNMIEILIGVSIIVTFSGLIGSVYYKKLAESKESYAKIEMNTIYQSLLLYHTRHGKWPLTLQDLVESGDLPSLRQDPWGNDYIYVPHLDWTEIIQATSDASGNEEKLRYIIQSIQQVAKILSKNVMDPAILLATCSKYPVVFSIGQQKPIFAEPLATNEDVKKTAYLIKTARERASNVIGLQQALDQLSSYVK